MPGTFQENDSDSEGEQEDSIVIAVMGVTGAGKSTFIKTVSGRNDVVVGDSLCSETSEVRAYEFLHNNKQYILVDTPGFDDTKRSDSQITEQILTWLKTSMLEGTKLNGVIYLHRISDTRMAGTALRNNRMFRKLCGVDAFKNIVLATTFWGEVNKDVGERREKELRENMDFWGGMLKGGAKMVRLQRERAAGLELVEMISGQEKVVLGAQDEMINGGQDVKKTSAMREESDALEKVQRELEAKMKAERIKLQQEEEKKKTEREKKLREEQDALKKKREQERVAEEKKRVKAKADAQRAHAKQLEDMRRERRLQEEKIKKEKQEMERKEREERQRQKEREEAAAAEVVRRRAEYQKNYNCIGIRAQWPCDKCKGKVFRYTVYYHCCFCHTDKYFHCGGCGNDCGEADHPYMTQRTTPDDCIVM
ncbi:P-loop containing nucleoside triphosphate hydrolase protein [Rhexocercosporidium sp. MPI-PUGE-AT-0058]|nr:P-loop containing nucleoside triphosphate hydrolase protein [Rhexocercosporidium sp. MPI-PUGE-AT-0058]